MAELLGTSVASIKRAFRGESLWFKNGKFKNQPELVREVTAYYRANGMVATKEQFPELSVKSIVDRPEYYGLGKHGRQIRWTDEQLAEAAKMSGLISHSAQARYFSRPNAYNGSIKSLWTKRFGFMGGSINGMSYFHAQHLVNTSAAFLKPKGNDRRGEPTLFRWIILWVDMESCLRPEVPKFIRDAIHTMADFQRWIWKCDDPRPLILKMMKEREALA